MTQTSPDISPAPLLPRNGGRVALVDPTKFLGNLLLAGGLMQDFSRWCRDRDIRLLIVLDESFRDLLGNALPDAELLFYPRGAIARGAPWLRAAAWFGCLRRLRAFRADLAFNIEEDSVSHRLTQLSGARVRLGCSPLRHRHGYEHVLAVEFVDRPAECRHRWYSFHEVFAALGMAEATPGYLRLQAPAAAPALLDKLALAGVRPDAAMAVLHAGATKDYKKWPPRRFAELAGLLAGAGLQPVLIGAGAGDREANAAIHSQAGAGDLRIPDLCDRLSLAELAAVLGRARLMVGNDSGPFHLGAALGLPGVVVFGPTEADLWAPLSPRSALLSGRASCAADCSRRSCSHGYRCLEAVTAEAVFDKLQEII